MGVVGSAIWTLGVVMAGAFVTFVLERRFTSAGPAARVDWKRNIHIDRPDRWMYGAGTVVALLGIVWGAVVIPFSPGAIGADLNIGLFYFIVVVDLLVLGIAMTGWGTNAPDGVEACYRVVAQLAAYVVPLGLAIIGPIMMAGSLSTVDIVEAQSGLWYVFAQPVGFALYVVCGLMQTYRAPFLEPFAEEIGAGLLGFSGGGRALLWRIMLSGLLFIVAAMGAVLFLGGYSGPFLPGPIWMALKTIGMILLMVWLGTRTRLLTSDEMLRLAWKVLIPVGLLNVLVVGALILLGVR